MNFKYLGVFFLFLNFGLLAQNNQKVLFTINNEPVYTQEFINVYNKNSNLIETKDKNGLENYLDLYINYKLKVKEAYELQLDTLQKFKNELHEYRGNLIAPYLKDKEVSEHLIKEAYDRLSNEVDVSHILLFLKPESTANDTLKAYNTLIEARNLIVTGEDFNQVALKYSEDPTVQQNGGRIGFFTGLQMVYPFENAAFKTNKDEVSMPFRTKFGYHILKVHNTRKSNGEVEVAHIMVKNDSVNGKVKIDSIYNQLVTKNDDFFELAKRISDDKASASEGGRLNKFGTGRMVENFANESFKLKNEGDISKPFQTPFGWHIVKLIKKYPIESFDILKAKITEQVNNDERSHLVGDSVIKKLFKEYNISVNDDALKQFTIDNWKNSPEKFKSNLLKIEDVNITQSQFISYLKMVNSPNIESAFVEFKEKEAINYYKQNIEQTNKEFASVFNEFKEGLLLFDLLEMKVWQKSKDSLTLSQYFNDNKNKKYNNSELKEIKGTVISDFQNYLENEWINDLHLKYKVEINKTEKRNLLKQKI